MSTTPEKYVLHLLETGITSSRDLYDRLSCQFPHLEHTEKIRVIAECSEFDEGSLENGFVEVDKETESALEAFSELELAQFEYVCVAIEDRLKQGMTLDDAVAQASSVFPDFGALARDVVLQKLKVNRWPLGGGFIVDNVTNDPSRWWYTGPSANSRRWLALRESLEIEGRMSGEDIAVLDDKTTRILGQMPAPGKPMFSGRGLVMGYVQSGKTTNFMGLIAKAADEGYRLVIVLSGVTNNLRAQTQRRMAETLVGVNAADWHWLTTDESDFTMVANATNLLSSPNQRLIAVVKKNATVLRRLKRWLNSANAVVRGNTPLLIVDDECDQASINTLNTQRQKDNRTAVNRILRELTDTSFISRNAYVGYSATPYANFFIDPTEAEGLYPRDFIVRLDRGVGYFGATELFGRIALDDEDETHDGVDIIRNIPNVDIDEVRPRRGQGDAWQPSVPPSMWAALRWFIIAHSIRTLRTEAVQWSTMMIHNSPNVGPHQKMKTAVQTALDSWVSGGLQGGEEDAFRDLYTEEIERAGHLEDFDKHDWAAIWEECKRSVASTKIVIDNYRSDDRLSYQGDAAPVIVIGGNTLSRGLTLEGLVSTFFIRTASAYDSLMQMGRWFGYRPGYSDLQRIWLACDAPQELAKWFRELAFVEEEIREQIDTYALESLTPSQVGIRVRQLPGMSITARARMQHAIQTSISYSGTRIQTILFDNDETNQIENLSNLNRFVGELESSIGHKDNSDGWPVFQAVPVDKVTGFIENYKFEAGSRLLQGEPILKYISTLNSVGELLDWNVAIYNNSRVLAPPFPLEAGFSVRMANRARMKNETRLDIKTLISVGDMVADAPDLKQKAREIDGGKLSTKRLQVLRGADPRTKNRPLLGIYLIDRKSSPTQEQGKIREGLGTNQHLVGLYIVFPTAASQVAANFFVANLDDVADLEPLDPESEVLEDENGDQEQVGPQASAEESEAHTNE